MTPSPAIRLLADRMLEGLARRLRLMGYDCASVPAEIKSDKEILRIAAEEGRVLITTARHLAELGGEAACLLAPGSLDEQVRSILGLYPIDHARLAFTRCSRDNAPLDDVPFCEVEAELPPLVREMRPEPVRRCPQCGRLYWPGTHLERLIRLFRQEYGVRPFG